METLPATCRLPRHTITRGLGLARRGRFLLQFDDWRRKFRTLGRAMAQAGLQRCVYYSWKTGKRVPQEAALRRVCERIGIDSQYVLTGIPGKVGDNHLTLCFYQQQHKEAKTALQRSRAFVRIATESFMVLLTEFPTMVLDGIGLHPEPIAILKLEFNPLLGFEISIQQDGDVHVGFEVSVLYTVRVSQSKG